MFSGGSYDEVARWLHNFLLSHAKRENPRTEVELASGEEREGKSYAARLRLGEKVSRQLEFDYKEVAENRGSLAWGRAMADRTRTDRLLIPAGTAILPPPRWVKSGDLNGFLGLALDNITQLVILAGVLVGVFQFPADLVLYRMVPGTALGVLVGDLAYTWLA